MDALRQYHDKVARLENVNARLIQDALAWRGCAEQLAARLYVLGEHSPALDNYERMVEVNGDA